MHRHVIVVEDRAHMKAGHFPVACADLARGLSEVGCDVELMTAEGWRGSGSSRSEPFTVTRAVPWVARLLRRSERWRERWLGMPDGMRRRAWREVADLTRSIGIALMVRGARRRSGDDADVISFAWGARPLYAAILDGPGRILHHTRTAPPTLGKPGSLPGHVIDRLARRAEAKRRARGGGMRLALGSAAVVEQWGLRAPYLQPVLLRHAARRDEQRVANAREELDIRADAKVALVFGTEGKNLDTIWQAFALLPEWTLLVVGKVAQDHRAWVARHGGPPAITRDGFVSDAVRAAAYSAADVVALTFPVGHLDDSAVLQEAISFGVPVVCTSGNRSAEEVARFRLGVVCPPDDPAAFADAVRRVPSTIAPDDLASARVAASAGAVAAAHLRALDAISSSDGTGR